MAKKKAPPEKRPTYSFTKLNTFDNCPGAYKLIYQDKRPRVELDIRNIGIQAHELQAKYLAHLFHRGIATDWEFAWKLLGPDAHPETKAIWMDAVMRFTLPDTWEKPQVESRMGFTDKWEPCGFFDPEVYFRMVVDLHFIQDGLAVVKDWKTSRMVPKEIEKDLQTRLYGWGVMRTFYPQAEEILLVLHYLRYGAERKLLLDPEDLAHVPSYLEEKIMHIEQEKYFNPTPGSFCGMCGVAPYCDAMTQALIPRMVITPATLEEAIESAKVLLAIESVGREIKRTLKAYSEECGPIPIMEGDHPYCYGPVPWADWDLNPEKVAAEAMSLGITREAAWRMLIVSKSSIEKVLKKEKKREFLDHLLATGTEDITRYMVKFYKPKAPEAPAEAEGEAANGGGA